MESFWEQVKDQKTNIIDQSTNEWKEVFIHEIADLSPYINEMKEFKRDKDEARMVFYID